jgi:hypothetical protein
MDVWFGSRSARHAFYLLTDFYLSHEGDGIFPLSQEYLRFLPLAQINITGMEKSMEGDAQTVSL